MGREKWKMQGIPGRKRILVSASDIDSVCLHYGITRTALESMQAIPGPRALASTSKFWLRVPDSTAAEKRAAAAPKPKPVATAPRVTPTATTPNAATRSGQILKPTPGKAAPANEKATQILNAGKRPK